MSSFSNSTNKFDDLLLQSLMGRLQLRPPPPSSSAAGNHSLLSQSLEDLLLDAVNNLSDFDDDDGEETDSNLTQLAREESKLKKEIIKVILAGNTDSLKPNSGPCLHIAAFQFQ